MKATGFRYGNLRQVTTIELVLTCHEGAIFVQRRLRVRMAAHTEVVLRQRFCHAVECRARFFLCSHCDRGQRYCSVACRNQARLRQRRSANRRHQQSPEGRLDHRDRQERYRRRRAERVRQTSVTDQGSLSIACSALSLCGPVKAPDAADSSRCGTSVIPGWSENRTRVRLRCSACGRVGRFIDQFPPIPRRR